MTSPHFKLSHAQIIQETFDDEAVIVDLNQGTYFSLAGSGAAIWNLALHGDSEAQIVAQIVAQTEANEMQVRSATHEFLQQLQDEGLIVACEQIEYSMEKPHDAAPATTERKAFVTPQLQKFSDMQALLLLDPIHEVDETGWPNVKALGEK